MATTSSVFEPEGQDRFSLLWLEEGEYYFRDYNCHLRRAADQTCAPQRAEPVPRRQCAL